MKAEAIFAITRWEEKPFSELERAGKLTRASVVKSYSGAIQGEGTLEYVMAYHPDGSAVFCGMERFIGRMGKRSGSFVFQHNGVFEKGEMRQNSAVVENSATGELVGLRGTCKHTAGHLKEYPFTFEYALKPSSGQ